MKTRVFGKCCECDRLANIKINKGKPDGGKEYCSRHYSERPDEWDIINKDNKTLWIIGISVKNIKCLKCCKIIQPGKLYYSYDGKYEHYPNCNVLGENDD